MRGSIFIFIILLLASVVATVWQRFGMHSELDILAMEGLRTVGIDDRTSRGRSRARLLRSEYPTMSCDLKEVAQWPYCQLQLKFLPIGEGLNLHKYQYLLLKLAVEGETDPGIRLYLPNFEKELSNLSDSSTLKVNDVEFFIEQDGTEHKIPLTTFQVAGWWRAGNRIPLRHSGMQVDNVSEIYLSTGSLVTEGQYKIQVLELKFKGKLLSESQLYFGLLLVWILFAMGMLISRWWVVSRQLSDSDSQRTRLEQLTNKLTKQTLTLSRTAREDGLTKLLNRAAYLHDMGQPHGQPICIFIIDLDHFKALNDEYGHSFGDEILILFAQLIDQNKRQQDRVYRWGGEEFVLICEHTNLLDADTICNKLLNACRDMSWPKNVQQRCSIGVASTKVNEHWQPAFERADQALYEAKSQGRDCAVVNYHGHCRRIE